MYSSLIHSIPILKEILDGIKIYFDFMLKDQLLYTEEMQQYDNVITKEESPYDHCKLH